jgi:hypothetical protein
LIVDAANWKGDTGSVGFYGDSQNAQYDAASDRIILVTSKNTKLWNPFSGDLLAELESGLNTAKLNEVKSQTQFYK